VSETQAAREVICTSCPRGCPLQVRLLEDSVQVTGAACKRGVAFGQAEAVDPKRVLTTTVAVLGGTSPVVSVRTRGPIPLRLIEAALAELRRATLEAPVDFGAVVLQSVAGSGEDVIATRAVPKADGSGCR